jgi:hypothetical protein
MLDRSCMPDQRGERTMNFRVIITSSLLYVSFCISAIASLNERLICIADASTGFKHEQGNWSISKFHIQNERYIVAPLNENSLLRPRFNYNVTQIGSATSSYDCYRSSEFPNSMGCQGTGVFSVNFKILRFQQYFVGGYIHGADHPNADTPFVTIGKCSQF